MDDGVHRSNEVFRITAPQAGGHRARNVHAVLPAATGAGSRIVPLAEVVAAFTASGARPARQKHLDRHMISDRESTLLRSAKAEGSNLADELMAGYQGERIADVAVEQMKVGGADADERDPDEHVLGPRLRHGLTLERHDSGLAKHHLAAAARCCRTSAEVRPPKQLLVGEQVCRRALVRHSSAGHDQRAARHAQRQMGELLDEKHADPG